MFVLHDNNTIKEPEDLVLLSSASKVHSMGYM